MSVTGDDTTLKKKKKKEATDAHLQIANSGGSAGALLEKTV